MTDIGLRLGESRGVIAGRIDRLRKSGDPRFAPRPKPAPKPKPIREPERKAQLQVEPEPLAGRRLLVDLAANGCRYPTGEAADGRHLFASRVLCSQTSSVTMNPSDLLSALGAGGDSCWQRRREPAPRHNSSGPTSVTASTSRPARA
jgi:hypothetical protein